MRYAAFLRAVNLGKNRRVSGAELCAIFEKVGLEDVASFRTSGNLVFDAPRDMTAQIEKALEKALGYDVGVFLRTAGELDEIVSQEPFKPAQVKKSKGKVQVSMLSAKPTSAKRKQVLALATGQDLLAFGERELFWLPSGGTMESTLDRKAIDELVGPTTMRTKGTVEQLVAKFFA
ncbi:MAG TPA: DUF1697 domain-containing protein [Thermoleophilaceae bacterium]